MPAPTQDRMREVFNVLEKHIESRYGVPIKITDVPDPFTGDLDGYEIHVDYAEDVESALFIIAHLFGHTAQWNTSAESRDIGYKLYENPTPEELAKLYAYEVEACRYSMTLFHEAGIHDLDQWLSDYSACDYRFLEHFYTTGEKRPFKSFWQEGSPMIEGKPLPEFTPVKWVARTEGIVV